MFKHDLALQGQIQHLLVSYRTQQCGNKHVRIIRAGGVASRLTHLKLHTNREHLIYAWFIIVFWYKMSPDGG